MIEMASEHYRRRAESEQKIWGDHSIEILDRLHLQAREKRIEEIKQRAMIIQGKIADSGEYPAEYESMLELLAEIGKI